MGIYKALAFVVLSLVIYSCNPNQEDASTTSKPFSAVDSLEEAVKQYPDSLPLLENLVEYYHDNGEDTKALELTNKALIKHDKQAELWNMKAILLFETGDSINAIHSFEHAISLKPDLEYLKSLGSLYAQTKNPLALALADTMVKADPTVEKEALFIKGLYYSTTGNKPAAIRFFDNCIRLDYTFIFAYREKAIALYDQEKYKEAITILNKAITVQNNFDEGYYWLGKCYEKLDNTEAAITNYKMALLYDKDFDEAREALNRLNK